MSVLVGGGIAVYDVDAQSARPNVVLIIADDQAFTDFGFMGHKDIKTPNLDRLARQSAVFPRGYVPTSLCRPSLASIVTGRWPHRHGVTGNDPRPGVDRKTVVARFRRARTLPQRLAVLGYRSLQTGKWWEGSYKVGGFDAGMTHGVPARGGRHGDEGLTIGRDTMQPIYDFIDGGSKQEGGDRRPFFVWYAPFLPHTPHNPPARLLQKYEKKGRSKFVARYYAMCEWFDESCGLLLDHLKKRSLEENTIVLFVADNGWIQRKDRRGFAPRSKRSPNEGGVRTPILVRWPKVVKPGRIEVPVSSIDLMATVLTACGAKTLGAVDGVDLLPLCRGEKKTRRPVFGASFTHDIVDLRAPAKSLKARWIVDGRFKLIAFARGAQRSELYDVVADPLEKKNLAAAEPKRVHELRKKIDEWWPVQVETRPNILLVVTDDQRNDMLGCAGHPVLKTPTMDSLAARGVRFANAFVTTAICAASRATLLTGSHRRTHGYTFGTRPLGRRHVERSYPRRLRSAGWRTGFVGKLGVRLERGAAQRMFDSYRPLRQPYLPKAGAAQGVHLTDRIADAAIEFVSTADANQPFCLSVSFWAPHAQDNHAQQYIWPKALDGMYDAATIAKPSLSDPKFFASQPVFLRESLGRVRFKWRFDTEQKRAAMTRGYYRMITGVDRALRRILAALDQQKVARRTVVIFTSDNGYFLGERGLAGKWLMYEPSIRVPMIVYDPRAPKNRQGVRADQMVLNLDLASTILDLAGLPIPKVYQGQSLVPIVRGDAVAGRAEFFYEHLFAHPKIPKSIGLRTKHYKYIRYFEQKPAREELYDLDDDPLEVKNLAKEARAAATLIRMRERCDALAQAYR